MLHAIPLFLLATLFQASPPARVPCRAVTETAALLRDVVAPNWATISKDEMLRRWPGLHVSPTVPEWPASLIGNADNLYCKESFRIHEQGGIRAMDLLFSATHDQVVDAAHTLSEALGFPLAAADRRELQRKGVLLLRQMDRVPPRGLDVELLKNLNGNAVDWGVKLTVITFPSAR